MRHLGYIFILLLILASCKTKHNTVTEYVYVNHTDTVHDVSIRIDSIVTKDSIVTLIKGDTVQIEKWHTAYRERVRVDTVERIITRTEDRTKTETVIQEVNRLYWWQKVLIRAGGIALICGIVIIIWKFKNRLR